MTSMIAIIEAQQKQIEDQAKEIERLKRDIEHRQEEILRQKGYSLENRRESVKHESDKEKYKTQLNLAIKALEEIADNTAATFVEKIARETLSEIKTLGGNQ